jgi:hypothetical protein
VNEVMNLLLLVPRTYQSVRLLSVYSRFSLTPCGPEVAANGAVSCPVADFFTTAVLNVSALLSRHSGCYGFTSSCEDEGVAASGQT